MFAVPFGDTSGMEVTNCFLIWPITYIGHAFVDVNNGCSLVFLDIQYNRDQENSPAVLKFRENLPACGMEECPEGFETVKTAKDCKTATLQ